MTSQKDAIKYFESRIKLGQCGQSTTQRKAFEAAIKALEKQIPTSMVLEGDGYADGVMIYDTWICPRCGKHYELEYDDYDYCPNCGQALDWEEDNGE